MMKRLVTTELLLICSLAGTAAADGDSRSFPWLEAGLSERQAAAHLLDRFAFGPRPGDLEQVLRMGLEEWFEGQLRGDLPDPVVHNRMRSLDAFAMSEVEIAQTFPRPVALLAEAARQGVVDRSELEGAGEGDNSTDRGRRRELRRQLMSWAEEEGYRFQRELIAQLYTQKILRAAYSTNQLHEVMTDFWFNHFNVSLTDNQSRGFVFSYERDAIRPHVAGSFRDLLGATARHPAMLTYLDNAQSSAEEGMPTTFDGRGRGMGRRRGAQGRVLGLNENYARELLELHTLGVDGGYSQDDVIEVARAFSGWTVVPANRLEDVRRRLRKAQRVGVKDFQLEGLFLFRANLHDAGKKSVLGHRLPAGRGIEDGEEVLDLVARHPSAAHHLATKLAVRFVSDEPPAALVDRLARLFLKSGGDVTLLLRELVYSKEFWAPEALRQKVKSPFEVAISSVRALDGEISNPRSLAEWISRMGQPLYAYQAPTGFPDRGEAWVNTGSLLNRMNFGLQLATGDVRGVHFDLAGLNGGNEPESVEDALATYLGLLLPERPAEPVLRQLGPVVRSPELARKVAAASTPSSSGEKRARPSGDAGFDGAGLGELDSPDWGDDAADGELEMEPTHEMVAQVVGVILGSPEFQRR